MTVALHLGTCSWKYPSWRVLVYPDKTVDYLHEYSKRYDCVEIDQWFYSLFKDEVYLHQAVPAWFEHKVDVIFRGAPHLLVVAAGQEAACPQEDVNLALAYFELMAACAGVGTVWCGLAKMTLELLTELKADLGLSPGQIYYTMLFGVPAVRYARAVQRDDTDRIRRIKV